MKCMADTFSHLYTLIIMPNNTYSVLIDNVDVRKGNLEEDFDFLPPKKINVRKNLFVLLFLSVHLLFFRIPML